MDWLTRRGQADDCCSAFDKSPGSSARICPRSRTELGRVARVTILGEFAASIAHEINQPLAAIVADANACLHWLAVDHVDIDSVRKGARRRRGGWPPGSGGDTTANGQQG